ncbi:hypothetical protein ACLF6K_37305 [Streptomyces xanthophaeus]|uniref:hypothetical protein n=1 Tax=Streptomyces xanthophaeus TaxID=67385 RepID=UPI00399006AD
MTPDPAPCEACELYQATLAGIVADWDAAGCPFPPDPYRDHIGAALAMYLQHQHSHQNA